MVSEYKRSRDYELMVIFHPELSEEDVVTESDRVQGFLTAAEASVTHVTREAPWGRRRLAYPIRHSGRDLRDGIYALYYFHAESGRIVDMEREIKLNDRIIRYLLTQQIAPIAEPEAPEGEEGAEAPTDDAGDAPARRRAQSEQPPSDSPTTEDGAVPATEAVDAPKRRRARVEELPADSATSEEAVAPGDSGDPTVEEAVAPDAQEDAASSKPATAESTEAVREGSDSDPAEAAGEDSVGESTDEEK